MLMIHDRIGFLNKPHQVVPGVCVYSPQSATHNLKMPSAGGLRRVGIVHHRTFWSGMGPILPSAIGPGGLISTSQGVVFTAARDTWSHREAFPAGTGNFQSATFLHKWSIKWVVRWISNGIWWTTL